jgi:tetratricopeptide (TPR) repeat protein
VLAFDRLTLGVEHPEATGTVGPTPHSVAPEWQRWNDYGIGLLNKGDKGSEKGELVQAVHAFAQVERLGLADGPLNLARVFFKEGRLDDAVAALQRASDPNRFDPPAPRWTVAWLNGLVNKQNGYLDKAIAEFRSILEDRTPELTARGLDFSRDYEVINELGQTLFERAKQERGNRARREDWLRQAARRFEDTLAIDVENLAAHHNLALIYTQFGDTAKAAEHRRRHEKYRPDDNARDRAIAAARRRDAAADHAAQAIVIYDLHRPEGLALSNPRVRATHRPEGFP